MTPLPAHYLNALRLIEALGRDMAAHIGASDMSPDAIEAAQEALAGMVRATEGHRALLEAAAQGRLQ